MCVCVRRMRMYLWHGCVYVCVGLLHPKQSSNTDSKNSLFDSVSIFVASAAAEKPWLSWTASTFEQIPQGSALIRSLHSYCHIPPFCTCFHMAINFQQKSRWRCLVKGKTWTYSIRLNSFKKQLCLGGICNTSLCEGRLSPVLISGG